MSKKASTMSLDSRLFRPSLSNSSSASSALVSVGVSRLPMTTAAASDFLASFASIALPVPGSAAQARAELAAGGRHDGGHGRLDALVGQCGFVVEQLQAHSQGALVGLQVGGGARRRLEDVEEPGRAQQ